MDILSILLDKKSTIPLYRQLSSVITGLISQGKLLPESRLPSIRQLANALDINTTTVVNAYKHLENDHYVYSSIGSGTFVVPMKQETETPAPVLHDKSLLNFIDTTNDTALFPVAAFKQSFDIVLERDFGNAFTTCDNLGYAPLRESFHNLAKCADKQCVHVISNTRQVFEVIANELLSPGDTIFIENYTNPSVVGIFLSRGIRVIAMPMTNDGPDFIKLDNLLKKYKPKLIYIMPNFQNPTGITYSTECKIRLISLTQDYGVYILEEDQLSDLYYDGIKRTPLMALCADDRVIFIKSYSKTIMPGIGFVVYPKELTNIFSNIENTTSGYIQRGFDLFIRSGEYRQHFANLRSVYGKRYHKLVSIVNTYLSHLADFELPGGGLSLWITPKYHDNTNYINDLLRRGVAVSPGGLFVIKNKKTHSFKLSFANINEERIPSGIGIIASVLGQSDPSL